MVSLQPEIKYRLGLYFERLFIPNFSNLKECVIELINNDNQRHHEYPMNIREPLIMKISNPIIKERTEITIIILIKELGKYKKIAKGKINIHQNHILNEQLYFEKYISLELYPSQTQKAIKDHIGKDIIATISNIGKIFVKAQLFDNQNENNEALKSKREDVKSIFTSSNEVLSLTKNIKKAIKKFKEAYPDLAKINMNVNRPDRIKSFNDKANQELKEIKKNKQVALEESDLVDLNLEEADDYHFKDGLSDISDITEENKEEEVNLYQNLELVNSELDEIVKKLILVYQERNEEGSQMKNEENEVQELSTAVNNIKISYTDNCYLCY